jgi:hypothetical protein
LLCLLVFTVSSAECLTAAAPASSAQAMILADHACCPGNASGAQISSSCCTVHHQPASSDSSSTDSDQLSFLPPVTPHHQLLAPRAAVKTVSGVAPVPLRLPPLIALRI